MSKKVIYFAYGSNMLTSHLCKRVGSIITIGRGKLLDFRFVCNKQSMDGSSKANLIKSIGDEVWGVLYEIELKELINLDRAEGGYNRISREIIADDGSSIMAFVYVSPKLTNVPCYDEYKRLIIEGASEHQLPGFYIEFLKKIPSMP